MNKMQRALSKVVLLALLCSQWLGQAFPQNPVVHFFVRGESGQPLSGVTAFDEEGFSQGTTGTNGELELVPRGALVGFARDGYCPATVSLDLHRTTIEVDLHPCSDREQWVPACSAADVQEKSGKRVSGGFGSILVPVDTPVERGADIEQQATYVYYGQGRARRRLLLGSGHGWVGPMPSRELREESVEMTVRRLITPRQGIPLDRLPWAAQREMKNPSESWYYTAGVDMQGALRDGRRWRYIGTRGSSTSYDPVYPEAADFFDALLQTLCMPQPSP